MDKKPTSCLHERPRILVVDDDPVASRLVARVAKFGGFDVRECPKPAEAVGQVRSWMPDLVVSDVKMPDIDGTELCVMLKADPETRQVPILLISSDEDFDQDLVGRFCGSREFLAKPYTALQLLRTINLVLGRVAAEANSSS